MEITGLVEDYEICNQQDLAQCLSKKKKKSHSFSLRTGLNLGS